MHGDPIKRAQPVNLCIIHAPRARAEIPYPDWMPQHTINIPPLSSSSSSVLSNLELHEKRAPRTRTRGFNAARAHVSFIDRIHSTAEGLEARDDFSLLPSPSTRSCQCHFPPSLLSLPSPHPSQSAFFSFSHFLLSTFQGLLTSWQADKMQRAGEGEGRRRQHQHPSSTPDWRLELEREPGGDPWFFHSLDRRVTDCDWRADSTDGRTGKDRHTFPTYSTTSVCYTHHTPSPKLRRKNVGYGYYFAPA